MTILSLSSHHHLGLFLAQEYLITSLNWNDSKRANQNPTLQVIDFLRFILHGTSSSVFLILSLQRITDVEKLANSKG